MITIDVGHGTAAKIGLLARAWNVTPGEAVERLLQEFEAGSSPAPPVADQQMVVVHAEYQGVRVRGLYDTLSRSLEITEGPAAGRRFKTPSAAAIAVVSAVNPAINPNRNGWSFWTITADGKRLQSIRVEG